MNKNPLYLCMDIGGSYIKYGVSSPEGVFLYKARQASKFYKGGGHLTKLVMDIIEDNVKQYDLAGVAISSTGIIDSKNAKVIYADDVLLGYTGFDFKKEIKNAFALNASACNDVNCVAVSELYEQEGNFISLTIGTGIGGGIVIRDELYEGHAFYAGEFGLMHLRDGRNFESHCSMSALVKKAKERKLAVQNGKQLFDLFDEGNADALDIVESFYKDMASGIANLIYAFSPGAVIIGGGISARGDSLILGISKYLDMIMDVFYLSKTSIRCARYGNDASMVGALKHHLGVYEDIDIEDKENESPERRGRHPFKFDIIDT